jgi:hypothetical protein
VFSHGFLVPEGNMPTLLDRKELQKFLHISQTSLHKLIHHPRNPLPCIRAGRKYLFDPDDVVEFLKQLAREKANERTGGAK